MGKRRARRLTGRRRSGGGGGGSKRPQGKDGESDEDYCFACKDGGLLRFCDYKGILDLSQGNLTFLELELAACQTGPPAPGTPQWSCSMMELVEQSWKNWSRAVPNRPLFFPFDDDVT